ncbi:hypothetical protein GCM10007972_26010 [Iodidimonas muriae]|uniref:Sigma-54 factor interaction domain-containing protein n=1 Tax=Iodidimonas muriae TaxID=261467 RepID=A0ABQ2LGD6_9PROT|nr:sigma-54 dependent transcriptional regulator [Iodidimonas muriae]GGO16677.1 hypothetical protein GCM10007972_26010 [Iodidimonas muriae]
MHEVRKGAACDRGDRSKRLLIIDPAREDASGAAHQVHRLMPLSDIAYTIPDKPISKLHHTYFCAVISLTAHVHISDRLYQQLLRLARAMRVIALIDKSSQGRNRVCRLLHDGVLYDFHTLPIDHERLCFTIGHLRGIFEHEARPKDIRRAPSAPYQALLLGKCPAMDAIRKQISQYAKTDLPVLIAGESGTGKELVARDIHQHSSRTDQVFLAINCATIPPQLAASELFGHEKGAFTNAISARPGRFEQASGGTLFLDEIADLSLDIQSQLLRVLEDGRIYRLGAHQPRQTNVRIIVASNINLEEAVRKKHFRLDLFHRLNVLPLMMPPLREREGDAILLAKYFIALAIQNHGLKPASLTEEAERAILAYSWPGNVRQLQNCIQRAMALNSSGKIDRRHLGLSRDKATAPSVQTLARARAEAESALLSKAIRTFDGNISRAATELGVSRVGLYRLLKRHDLDHKQLVNGGKDHDWDTQV